MREASSGSFCSISFTLNIYDQDLRAKGHRDFFQKRNKGRHPGEAHSYAG